ncbi:hypothetical protein T484DRAFT_3644073, partial [Baffinella frigidus]
RQRRLFYSIIDYFIHSTCTLSTCSLLECCPYTWHTFSPQKWSANSVYINGRRNRGVVFDGEELLVSGFGFRDSGFGLRVSSFGFRVLGFGFRASGFGLRASGFGFRVSRFEVRGLWSRVQGF